MHSKLWDGHQLVEFFFYVILISTIEFTCLYYCYLMFFFSFLFCGDEDIAFFGSGQME